MGNCQAVDAAVLVIQHPSGREERLYWPVTARQVMKTNPGHYVSLIIPLPPSPPPPPPPAAAVVSRQPNNHNTSNSSTDPDSSVDGNKAVRFTRVKLLRPTDTLLLGRAYRLITSQEVRKVLRAKKHAKTEENQSSQEDFLAAEPPPRPREHTAGGEVDARPPSARGSEKTHPEVKQERHRAKKTAKSSTAAKSKSWRPSLQSIKEAAS